MRTPETLYHFTSAHHLTGIKKSGIEKGAVPFRLLRNGKVTFLPGYQWLTVDPDFAQSWAEPSLTDLPYRKNEYRLTIQMPNFAMGQLVSWLDFSQKVQPQSAAFIASFRGYRHWWLFQGIIPASWISETLRNPTPIQLDHLNESLSN